MKDYVIRATGASGQIRAFVGQDLTAVKVSGLFLII
mgnify:CR=1 FL=1